MKTLKKGLPKKKRVEPPLPEKFIGTKVECYNCKAEFELEAQDTWYSIDHHHDVVFYVKCIHCGGDGGHDIYVGDDR